MTRPPDDPALVQLLAAGTATVSDALDRLGLLGSAHGIAPLANGQRMAGPAYTVRYVPVGDPKGTVGDYIDDIAPGSVAVLDNQGRTDATVWGDILTPRSRSRSATSRSVLATSCWATTTAWSSSRATASRKSATWPPRSPSAKTPSPRRCCPAPRSATPGSGSATTRSSAKAHDRRRRFEIRSFRTDSWRLS